MTEDHAPLRVALYARQSVQEDEGIDQQLKLLEKLAGARDDWQVVRRYADNATSATKERGPGTDWATMLDDFDAGVFDAVYSVAIDRLLRSIVDAVKLRKPHRPRDMRVMTVRDSIDTGTTVGRSLLVILVALAEQEIETKKARAIPYKNARHKRGVPTPGRVPYGYRWITDLERKALKDEDARYAIEQDQAEAVRYVFRAALAALNKRNEALNLGTIAAALNTGTATNKDGSPLAEVTRTTKAGALWRTPTLRRMLLSPYYAALLPPISSVESRTGDDERVKTWRAEDVSLEQCTPGHWEPLVEEADLARVRNALLSPGRRAHDGDVARKHLLPAIARCGKVLAEHDEQVEVCGAPIRSAWSKEKLRAYKCPNGHFQLRAELLDSYVVGAVLDRLAAPDASALLNPAPEVDVPALRAQEAALIAANAELDKAIASGLRTFTQVEHLMQQNVAQLADLHAALAAAFRHDPLADALSTDDVRAYWEDASLSRQRVILDALVEPIVRPVGKGTRIVDTTPVGRQVHVSEVVTLAWRRTLVGKGTAVGLTEDAKRVLSS